MRAQTRHILGQILQYSECESISGLAMEYLEDVFELYLSTLAIEVMRCSESNNRSKPTWKDCLVGLQDVVDFEQLEIFCKQEVELEHEPIATPAEPAKVETVAEEVEQDPFGQDPSKRIAIPSHFPPFPPPHSYLQTKPPLHPIKEDLVVRKKRIEQSFAMEENLKRLLLKSFKITGFRPLMDSDLGFVDFTNPKIP